MDKQEQLNLLNTFNEHTTDFEDFDIDALEYKLEEELESQFSDLEFTEKERELINNPDHLSETIMNVIWDQFMNQIAITAGEDFIEENRGLTLDLSKDAHIQTTENFANGKIATHNTEINYQERYDNWQSNFQRDRNIEHKHSNYRYNEDQKVWEQHDNRSDTWKKVLNKDARDDFDANRPKGDKATNTQMDHTVSAAEIIRDPAANAHMTREEQIAFANSDKNLNLMDSSANQSKGDSTMSEWLNSERDGKKPADRFNINEDELRQKDKEARKEYNKVKEYGEKRSVAAGKKSQKDEFYRISGKALRTALMSILATLVKTIMGKLVLWLKSTEKNFRTLIQYIKDAIISFVQNLKELLVNVSTSVLTTIATSIISPVVGIVQKTENVNPGSVKPTSFFREKVTD